MRAAGNAPAEAGRNQTRRPDHLPDELLWHCRLTSYFGRSNAGKPKSGETVVVSAAAGSVGMFVGQIAKIKGCRTIGIAGSADKCAFLTSKLGYDAPSTTRTATRARPCALPVLTGSTSIFDNVGGDILEACLANMRNFGRIACCGAVSTIRRARAARASRRARLIVTKRLQLNGFVVMDFAAQYDRPLADLKSWVESGKLKVYEDIIDGFENCRARSSVCSPERNIGKRMVKVV